MAFLCSARHLTRLSSRLLSGAAATSSSSLIPASSTALKFPSLSRSAALSTSVLPSLPSSSLTSTPIFTESARRAFSTSEHRYAPSRAPSAILNSNVLDDERLKDLVQPDVWHAFLACRSNGTPMPKALKNSLARAIREWAQSRGCETYALWFSPVRGPLHGEKLETFLGKDFSNGGRLIVDLSGTELFQTETDGSSFPNGGLRVTHRAAAYVAWDTQSSPFIYRNTLYIPAAFVSWTGDALDNKVPLLRSNAAINEQALRVLNHLGDHKSHHVITNVGWEQEFFILDRESYLMRPDLVNTGRCLQGRPPLRGQAQSANYFAKMPLRVRQYMQALREEFWKVGISVKALHNEVAPAQHEVCPIFSATSSAADTNILAMEIMRDLAYEHNLFILFHEKPFKGVNGSGKHLNWGLNTDTGHNLFVLGKSAADRKRFVTFTTAVLRAVRLHGDLLRCSIATAGNDHRLGAHEAPPAIITLGMGAQLEEQLKKIANGNNALDDIHTESDRFLPLVASVPGVTTTVEDRNRTAPIPWCGNRFEFRACGSNQHIAWPLAMLHAAVADSLKHIADQCDAGKSIDEVVRQTLKENQGALFSGNGYDQNILLPHVKKEGLYNLRTSPEAYARLSDAKNVKLLADLKIFSERETLARQQLLQEAFAIDIVIEGNTLLNMLRTGVAPACAKALAEDTVIGKLAESSAALYKPRREAHAALLKEIDLLSTSLDNFPSSSAPAEQAEYALNNIKPILATARKQADILENLVEARLWPYPSLDRVLHRR